MRLAIAWKALSECPSHRVLLDVLAEEHNHRLLALIEGEMPTEGISPEITCHPARTLHFGHPTLDLLSGWMEAFNQFSPEVLLAFYEPYSLQATVFSKWAIKRKIPIIFLSCQNIDRKLPLPFCWMEKNCLSHAQGGWFLNREAAQRARKRGFRGVEAVIPLGVPKELFDFPIRKFDLESPLQVGFVGRLVPEKGVEDLFAACAQITCVAHIAGEGSFRPELESLAARLGLSVAWHGHITGQALLDFYRTIEVLVLPSRTTPTWKEQFGRVLAEAMAAGVPVIGSSSGEIPNVIGSTGLIFREGDVSSLVQRLNQIQEKPQLVSRLAVAGRTRAQFCFTWEKVADSLNGLIHRTYGAMG